MEEVWHANRDIAINMPKISKRTELNVRRLPLDQNHQLLSGQVSGAPGYHRVLFQPLKLQET